MSLVNFKKGLLANLASAQKTAGTLYVTTDERAIYLDVDGTNRIRIGDFQVFANIAALNANQHPSETALYYVEDINCLARWDGQKYVQINPDTDTGATSLAFSGSDNGMTASYDAETRKITITMSKAFVTSTEVDSQIDAKVGDIGEHDTVADYVDAKTSGIASDEELTALKGRVGDLETASATHQTKEDAASDKQELAGEIAKKADKTDLETANSKITALETKVGNDTVANQIDSKIDALDLENTYAEIDHTHEMSEVEGLETALADKATKTQLETEQGRITALEANDKTQDSDIATLKEQIKGVTGAMHFVGKVEYDPAEKTDYTGNAGDVVVYGQKEFVYDGEKFVELGDVTAETQRIGELETKMTAAQSDISDLEAKLEGIDDTVTSYVSGQISTAKSDLTGNVGGVNATTIQGAVAEANEYTDEALDEIDAKIDGIQDELDGLDEKYDTKGTAAAAVKAIQNGEDISDFAGVEAALEELDEAYDAKGTAANAVKAIQNGESISDFGGVEDAIAALDEEYDAKGDAAAAQQAAQQYTDTALTWGDF